MAGPRKVQLGGCLSWPSPDGLLGEVNKVTQEQAQGGNKGWWKGARGPHWRIRGTTERQGLLFSLPVSCHPSSHSSSTLKPRESYGNTNVTLSLSVNGLWNKVLATQPGFQGPQIMTWTLPSSLTSISTYCPPPLHTHDHSGQFPGCTRLS